MIKRTSPPKRTAPPRKVNTKRRKSEFARCYHSKERVEFVRALPCVLCGVRPSENAHIGTGGMGRKAAASAIVPLCQFHHRVYHSIGRARLDAWWAEDGINVSLTALAAETQTKWLAYLQEKST